MRKLNFTSAEAW